MKVKLLNDGLFTSLKGLSFPLVVEATLHPLSPTVGVKVKGVDLIDLGAPVLDDSGKGINPDTEYNFFIGRECDIIE